MYGDLGLCSRVTQRENVAGSQGTRRTRHLRRSLHLQATNPDLSARLTALCNETGEDLREQLSSQLKIPPIDPTNGNRRMDQGANERRHVTPSEQGVTPTTVLIVVIMLHNLRTKCEISKNTK